MSPIKTYFCICLVVVLPPLPGDGGEIYDDVVDPNLEVRWEVNLFKLSCKQQSLTANTRWGRGKEMQVFSCYWLVISSPLDTRSTVTKPLSFLRMFDRNRRSPSTKV